MERRDFLGFGLLGLVPFKKEIKDETENKNKSEYFDEVTLDPEPLLIAREPLSEDEAELLINEGNIKSYAEYALEDIANKQPINEELRKALVEYMNQPKELNWDAWYWNQPLSYKFLPCCGGAFYSHIQIMGT